MGPERSLGGPHLEPNHAAQPSEPSQEPGQQEDHPRGREFLAAPDRARERINEIDQRIGGQWHPSLTKFHHHYSAYEFNLDDREQLLGQLAAYLAEEEQALESSEARQRIEAVGQAALQAYANDYEQPTPEVTSIGPIGYLLATLQRQGAYASEVVTSSLGQHDVGYGTALNFFPEAQDSRTLYTNYDEQRINYTTEVFVHEGFHEAGGRTEDATLAHGFRFRADPGWANGIIAEEAMVDYMKRKYLTQVAEAQHFPAETITDGYGSAKGLATMMEASGIGEAAFIRAFNSPDDTEAAQLYDQLKTAYGALYATSFFRQDIESLVSWGFQGVAPHPEASRDLEQFFREGQPLDPQKTEVYPQMFHDYIFSVLEEINIQARPDFVIRDEFVEKTLGEGLPPHFPEPLKQFMYQAYRNERAWYETGKMPPNLSNFLVYYALIGADSESLTWRNDLTDEEKQLLMGKEALEAAIVASADELFPSQARALAA